MTTITKRNEPTANEAFTARKIEARRLAESILKALQEPIIDEPHWGHVGNMGEALKNLRAAAHWLDVPGGSND